MHDYKRYKKGVELGGGPNSEEEDEEGFRRVENVPFTTHEQRGYL